MLLLFFETFGSSIIIIYHAYGPKLKVSLELMAEGSALIRGLPRETGVSDNR